MEDLAVITALTHYGSFGKHFVERRKKTVTHQPRSVRIGKNCALCLKYAATHSLAAIGSQLSTVPCLYSLQPPPPSTPFILLKKYYLRWNHLTAPCGFTLVLNIVGIISMINKAADPGELCLMFDLSNITLRNIKTKTKKPSIKNVQLHLIPSYPYLQVLHKLKLYSQFEGESKQSPIAERLQEIK